jgi:hypothetical protein
MEYGFAAPFQVRHVAPRAMYFNNVDRTHGRIADYLITGGTLVTSGSILRHTAPNTDLPLTG